MCDPSAQSWSEGFGVAGFCTVGLVQACTTETQSKHGAHSQACIALDEMTWLQQKLDCLLLEIVNAIDTSLFTGIILLFKTSLTPNAS